MPKKHTESGGREYYTDVSPDDDLSEFEFQKYGQFHFSATIYRAFRLETNIGIIIITYMENGEVNADYYDENRNYWLMRGYKQDVRAAWARTIGELIACIKTNATECLCHA